jgi:hypothetical protein
MFSLPRLGKLTFLVAAAAVAAPLALSSSASAHPARYYGHAHHGGRYYHGPRYYPHAHFYGARCYTNRKLVGGVLGPHWVRNRQCY